MSALELDGVAVADMPLPALRDAWRRVLRTPPPDSSADLLARAIAWELQAQQHGRLPPVVARQLDRLASEQGSGAPRSPASRLAKLGTQLRREWGDRAHVVTVAADGYHYDDSCYGSLSAIATVITGTRWSGPRFFGLTAKGRAGGRRTPAAPADG